MARPRPSRPTDTELSILKVLWERGPSTVREVFDALGSTTGYTTTLKLMQIMAEKGLVDRDESARTHVYHARSGQDETQRALVSELVTRVFGGSAATLVMHALHAHPATPAELAEIQRLIHDYKKGKGKK